MEFLIDQDPHLLRRRIFTWLGARFGTYAVLDSNGFSAQNRFAPLPPHDLVVAAGSVDGVVCDAGCWQALAAFHRRHGAKGGGPGKWMFGYLAYDLKNETEQLVSANPDFAGLPRMHFFVPAVVLTLRGSLLTVVTHDDALDPATVWAQVNASAPFAGGSLPAVAMRQRTSAATYRSTVEKILAHLQRGDVYELNYCMEFYHPSVAADAIALYQRLNAVSPAPFSALFRGGDAAIISSSPERFLALQQGRLISQPMKGTAPRDADAEADRRQAMELHNSAKERAENIMITDLVRNDLSRSAARDSVRVDELCGVYAFATVHQMISTVSCILREGVDPVTALRNAFPMGSMTGAPKVMAMTLIDRYEEVTRGVYSGALGYFDPLGNFDFSVLIRTLVYNTRTGYLSYGAGSAITAASDPEAEYRECLLKAEAMEQVFAQAG